MYGDGGCVTVWRWRIWLSKLHSIKTGHFNVSRWTLMWHRQQLSSCHWPPTRGVSEVYSTWSVEMTLRHRNRWWSLTVQCDWVCLCDHRCIHSQLRWDRCWKFRGEHKSIELVKQPNLHLLKVLMIVNILHKTPWVECINCRETLKTSVHSECPNTSFEDTTPLLRAMSCLGWYCRNIF